METLLAVFIDLLAEPFSLYPPNLGKDWAYGIYNEFYEPELSVSEGKFRGIFILKNKFIIKY